MGTYIDFFKEHENKIKTKKKGITVTVSGLSGSGKTTVAEAIAKALKLKLVNSGDIYREMAKEKGVTLEKFAAMHNDDVDYEIDRRNLMFSKEGGYMLVGRISGWVAGDNADLRIFVKCSLKRRAERVAERDKKSIEKAMADIKKRDDSDIGTAKKLYGVNLTDESIYDMVVDNDMLDYQSAKIIPVKEALEILRKKRAI